MQQVERHIIIDDRFEDVCKKAGLLYNYTLYQLKQPYFEQQKAIRDEATKLKQELNTDKLTDEQWKDLRQHINLNVDYIEINDFIGKCVKNSHADYRNLPAQTSQQVIKQVYKAWFSFWQSIKSYKKNPKKFLGMPKPPNYKKNKKQNLVVFTNQQVKLKDGFIHFPKAVCIEPIKTKVTKIDQVRIIPQATCYVVEVVYTKEIDDLQLNKENILSLDIGLNNLLTSIDNVGQRPFIVNGKHIKSYNKFWNKLLATAKEYVGVGISNRQNNLNHKRNNWMHDKMHQVSRFVINYCIKHNIGRIIIGKNDG